jgi:hypothetical protein
MWEYGCVRCQQYHRECDPLYQPHIMCQSKHGLRFVGIEEAIARAAAVAHFAADPPTPGATDDATRAFIDGAN